MIGILDQFDVSPGDLQRMLSLIEKDYLPGAIARGMTQKARWISPPVALPDATNTLWVMWEVPDVSAWWGMRFRAGSDPSVALYWKAIDALCANRQRRYLVDAESAHVAGPAELGTERITRANGTRLTAQYFLRTDAGPSDLATWKAAMRDLPGQIPGLQKAFLGENLEGSFHAGDCTFDAHFADTETLRAAISHRHWTDVIAPLQQRVVERATSIELQLISGGLRRPAIGPSIKRTAYFRVLPSASAESIAAFEKAVLDMPAYMSGMNNWSLSRSASDDRLYIWEQEYLRLDDLLGEYMMHPYHWSHVDTWFDPEFSRPIIDTDICHAFCASADDILAWTLQPQD